MQAMFLPAYRVTYPLLVVVMVGSTRNEIPVSAHAHKSDDMTPVLAHISIRTPLVACQASDILHQICNTGKLQYGRLQ